MIKYTCTIVDPIGLHARPASIITAVASKYKSNCNLIVGERTANIKSIMNIMSLGIKTNTEVTFSFDGEDEEDALQAIKEVLVSNKLISE